MIALRIKFNFKRVEYLSASFPQILRIFERVIHIFTELSTEKGHLSTVFGCFGKMIGYYKLYSDFQSERMAST